MLRKLKRKCKPTTILLVIGFAISLTSVLIGISSINSYYADFENSPCGGDFIIGKISRLSTKEIYKDAEDKLYIVNSDAPCNDLINNQRNTIESFY